jgi:hypothetical protein
MKHKSLYLVAFLSLVLILSCAENNSLSTDSDITPQNQVQRQDQNYIYAQDIILTELKYQVFLNDIRLELANRGIEVDGYTPTQEPEEIENVQNRYKGYIDFIKSLNPSKKPDGGIPFPPPPLPCLDEVLKTDVYSLNNYKLSQAAMFFLVSHICEPVIELSNSVTIVFNKNLEGLNNVYISQNDDEISQFINASYDSYNQLLIEMELPIFNNTAELNFDIETNDGENLLIKTTVINN